MGARGESAHSPSEIVGVGEVFLQLQHLYWDTLPCTFHPYSIGRGGLPKIGTTADFNGQQLMYWLQIKVNQLRSCVERKNLRIP